MTTLTSSFLPPRPCLPGDQYHHPSPSLPFSPRIPNFRIPPKPRINSSPRANWTLSDGNSRGESFNRRTIIRKKPLSDDDARRIIKEKARNLSLLRRNQGCQAQTPRWIRRTPEQMERLLKDDRSGNLYGKHVVAAIKTVRGLSTRAEGSYDVRQVMSSFVAKLTFREMCVVLKEQRGWRQARDFFSWMKLQLCYRPSVVVYTLILRIYGQAGKIKLAEQAFLEMIESGCEPDEVACGTMLCIYARWTRHKAMLSFFSAVLERGITPSIAVFNFMMSSLQKKSLHPEVIKMWKEILNLAIAPNHFTYTIVINSFMKEKLLEEALDTLRTMKKAELVADEMTYSFLISLCVKLNQRDTALKLYEDMKSQNVNPSCYTYSSILALHYKDCDFPKALALFMEMESNKVAADEVIYGIVIRIYGKLGLYVDAENTFKELEHMGLLTNEKTYLAMVQVHLNAKNYDRALSLLEQMQARNMPFSAFAYGVMLHCYVCKEDVCYAESTFQTMSKIYVPDATVCDDMLNLYLKLGLLEKAKAFIELMHRDTKVDRCLYRTIIRVYCKEGLINQAEEFVNKMQMNGLAMDDFIRTSLIGMYSYSGRPNDAENIFKTLEEPDAVSLSIMLHLHLENGDYIKINALLMLLLKIAGGVDAVGQLIRRFVKSGEIYTAEKLYFCVLDLGKRPQDISISSMISFYGRQHQLSQAKRIFDSVVDSSVVGRPIYSSMIDAYARCGKLEEASHLYEEMLTRCLGQDAVTLSVMVNAFTNHGRFQDAESMIRRSFQENMEIDTIAYNTFLKAMLEAGKLQFSVEIYNRMTSSGVPSSLQTYTTMISVYGKSGNLHKAAEMFNTALSLGIKVDEKAYTNMISCYGNAGKPNDAWLLFDVMQKEGIRPGKELRHVRGFSYTLCQLRIKDERALSFRQPAEYRISYNTMINAFAVAGLHQQAEQLVQTMENRGLCPDLFTYLALIRAYTQSQKYSEAEEVINLMSAKGVLPSCTHFSPLISAFSKEGLVSDTERIYGRIIEAGLQPDMACQRTMLKTYLENGLIDEGISFFGKIRGSIRSDAFILSAAVHLYEHAGMNEEATKVMELMKMQGLAFLKTLRVGRRRVHQ